MRRGGLAKQWPHTNHQARRHVLGPWQPHAQQQHQLLQQQQQQQQFLLLSQRPEEAAGAPEDVGAGHAAHKPDGGPQPGRDLAAVADQQRGAADEVPEQAPAQALRMMSASGWVGGWLQSG